MMDRHYERMSQGWETMKNEVAQRHARFMNKWDREMEDLKYSVGMVVGVSDQFSSFYTIFYLDYLVPGSSDGPSERYLSKSE